MKRTKKIAVGFVAIIMCVYLAACGKTEPQNTPVVLQVEPIKEDISECPTEEDTSGNKPDENSNKDAADTISQEVGENPVEEPDNLEEKTESEKTESINGDIESIENNGFSFSKSFKKLSENGGEVVVATSIEADKEIIKVTYTDATKFIVCTSTDGITGEYTDGSAADLKTGKSADLEGYYEGEVFIAQKVTIYNFL